MYYEIFSDNSFSPLKVNVIGYSSDPKITRFGPARRDLYIIHYVIKGKGYYNGVAVTAGQGFIIYPGIKEEYHPDPDDPWEFLWVISSDHLMKEIFDRYSTIEDTLIFDYNSQAAVKEIANEVISGNNEIVDSLKILEMFLKVLSSHIYEHTPIKKQPNYKTYLDFCVEYISANVHKKITVDELTTLTGVSQPYLHKIFKSKFDISTKQYITKYKMTAAKKLLVKTDMSITEIANSVGYSDVLSFSKAFSAIEKLSPQKYRLFTKDKI